MIKAQTEGKLQGLWSRLGSAETGQAAVAAALQELASARHTPPSLQHATQLLNIVEDPAGNAAALVPALTLLARWARQQGLQPAAARHPAGVHHAVLAACRLLTAADVQPSVAASCLLLLGSAATALTETAAVEEVAEAVGTALLCGQLGAPKPAIASDAAAAVGSILPHLLGKPMAAGWLLGALLQWLGGCAAGIVSGAAAYQALDCLAPVYGLMRGVAIAVLARSPPAAAVQGLLRPAYSVLKTAVAAAEAGVLAPSSASASFRMVPGEGVEAEAAAAAAAHEAAAVLGIAGLAEGTKRSAPGYVEAAQLAGEAERTLVDACAAAAAAGGVEDAGQAWPQVLQLRRDACSLAATLLGAAVRNPHLSAAPDVAHCQASSLLHSALSLGPLTQAAAALLSPAQAAQQVRQQVGSALVQHAGSMARTLAEQYPLLDAPSQQRVLQRVQAAAQQARQHYQQYSLATPTNWLAAMDGAAVRQLLDRLFLSCLVLLAAAWQAAPQPAAAGAEAAAQRAQLAAGVLLALADLQFCRVVAAPQYGPLLTAVLAELPEDAGAASSLAASLPCYAELAAACPARAGQPAWLADGVAAAKVQLLMLALVSCCGTLSQDSLDDRLAPLAFLYLLHPHRPLAAAAHQLFCALLMAVVPSERRAPLAAYYVQRCLEGCPGATLQLLPEFGQGLATVLQALPVCSPMAVLCVQQVLDRWEELAASGHHAALELAPTVAQQLLLVDQALLGEAIDLFDRVLWASGSHAGEGWAQGGSVTEGSVLAAPAPALPAAGSDTAQAALRREMLAAVRSTDDCLRKSVLARWLLKRQGSLGGRGGSIAVAEAGRHGMAA